MGGNENNCFFYVSGHSTSFIKNTYFSAKFFLTPFLSPEICDDELCLLLKGMSGTSLWLNFEPLTPFSF